MSLFATSKLIKKQGLFATGDYGKHSLCMFAADVNKAVSPWLPYL
jgi:hypothetical protein